MKVNASFVILATAALAVVSAQTGPFTSFADCVTSPTQLTTTSFSLAPVPMCIAKPYCLTTTGTLSTAIIAGAKLAILGKYLQRVVYIDNRDLCTVLAANGTPCPVAAGPITLNMCINVKPNFWPNVPTNFQFQAVNGDGNILFCKAGKIPSFALNL
ncbi:hypothetical protein BGW39_002483 [Mortierella sp. 14UC]|nr:hypothetical protein BGW39_002483 [Mortierella sp. 14UC]